MEITCFLLEKGERSMETPIYAALLALMAALVWPRLRRGLRKLEQRRLRRMQEWYRKGLR